MKSIFLLLSTLSLIVIFPNHDSYAQNCSATSKGFIPLNDLGTGLYQGMQGGLYPNGSNQRPFRHDSAGLALARQIKPLNSSGVSDSLNGKIVLVSIGMSNATAEFSTFKPMADTLKSKNPQLVIVDGAEGGKDAKTISNPADDYWAFVNQPLAAAAVTPQQVQVAW